MGLRPEEEEEGLLTINPKPPPGKNASESHALSDRDSESSLCCVGDGWYSIHNSHWAAPECVAIQYLPLKIQGVV
jgi:hypothetical protein